MPLVSTKERGKKAEMAAKTYLEQRGYRVIACNVSYKIGEIDLIAWDGQVLCFVEVRSKRNSHYGEPKATINLRKQLKIAKVAELYLQHYYPKRPMCRFDVISIIGYGEDQVIEHIVNAFEAPMFY